MQEILKIRSNLIRFFFLYFSIITYNLFTPNLAISSKNATFQISQYKAALLADAETGRILINDRIHQRIYPASLVKMMVALITLEEIKSGKISLKDYVTVSRWASMIGGHQVYLKQGEKFKLSELMKATVIGSANDAAVAVAEHVSGSDKLFIKRMNNRAEEIGMVNTRFFSVHGLPPGKNQKNDVSSAYDFLLLALELLKHRKFLKWSSTRLDTFRNGTFQLLNTNHRLIKSFNGMEGMKTGYHRKAGYNLVSTAVRNGQRFISIVIGARNSLIRRKNTKKLLNYGFENFLKYDFNKKGELVSLKLKVNGGIKENVSLKATEAVSILLSTNELRQLQILHLIPKQISAPVKEKQTVGRIEYWLHNKMLKQVTLQSKYDVPKQSIFSSLEGMFTNLTDTN